MNIAYKFDHTSGTYTFNSSFEAEQLNIGGEPDFSFERPFGSTTFYQVASGLPKPKPFALIGTLAGNTTTWLAEAELDDLQTALETCTKLYSSDTDGSGEAFVLCDGASQPLVMARHPTSIKVAIYFFPNRLTWKLSSDSSETVI